LLIYQGDFFDVLGAEGFQNSFDLVVTSPPYFDARNYGGEAPFDNPDDWLWWCVRTLLLLKNVVKEDGGVIWWNTGSGYRDHKKMIQIYDLIAEMDSKGLYLIDEIPWCKTSGPPKRFKNRPQHMWEHNYILAPDPSSVEFYRDNVREPYSEATLKRMKYKVSNLQGDKEGEFTKRKKVEPHPDGKVPNNYLLLPQDTSGRPHPAPMTPKLANWAIRAYSQEGDTVLDPMAGIGTTWIECEKLNRQFIGIELIGMYIDIANLSMKRLRRGDNPYNGLKKEWEAQNG
jgi:DNA modification methylase